MKCTEINRSQPFSVFNNKFKKEVKKLFIKSLLIIISVALYNPIQAQTYNEILGRPTNSSITISALFSQQTEVYWEYGTISGAYTNSTTVYTALKNTPLEVDFTNLQSNTKYYYRTRYRLSGTNNSYTAGTEHTFYTQRAPGSTFSFTIEADEHLYDKKGVKSIYQICLNNQAKDKPDFMLSLGDTFGDDHYPNTITSQNLDSLHKAYRPFLGSVCHSIPFFFCLGNHEGEKDYYLHQTVPNNIAVWGTLWRKYYYPNPYPNDFYSGNTEVESYGMGNPENYYSWTWGDALFLVLDVYRYDCDTSAKPKNWSWTLGYQQYQWLKNTLESSTSKYKFVFAHHVSGEGRGGIEQAKLFEWGGLEANGITDGFSKNRPGWEKPIHQLFVDYGVNIFFQGHDHLFAQEVMDGVIYQEVPMPSDSTYEIGMLANADAYVSNTVGGTGHIRVTVSPSNIKVDFVRAYLPKDTLSGIHHNQEIAFTYTTGDSSTAINESSKTFEVKVLPNPARDNIQVLLPNNNEPFKINIFDLLGKIVFQGESNEINVSNLTNGMYILYVKTANYEVSKKVIINR